MSSEMDITLEIFLFLTRLIGGTVDAMGGGLICW